MQGREQEIDIQCAREIGLVPRLCVRHGAVRPLHAAQVYSCSLQPALSISDGRATQRSARGLPRTSAAALHRI